MRRPLHEAVENGDIELVRLLLSYGADPLLSTYAGQTPLSLVKDNNKDLKEYLVHYLNDIQGKPSAPWTFSGIDDFGELLHIVEQSSTDLRELTYVCYFVSDRELNGYDPLEDPPSPDPCDEVEMLEFEMSDTILPSLYRFNDEFDHWVLLADLPSRVRDAVTRRPHGDQSPSQYVVRKVSRTQYEENVNNVMFLDPHKHVFKSKSKTSLITMVKYNDKLLAALNIQKVSMALS